MTEQSEDRLDRIERILEQSAKEHAEHFADINKMFANAVEQFNRNEERFAALGERLDQLSRDIGFLYAVVNGNVSQPASPAHKD
ncbi:MAG: hypothetical protein F4Y84_09125 [Caldilineaceae bacterium SB0665_bin_25]|nr:hypothetical protein [Caldilineaceae bacterium SB0665_bin_25]